MGQSREDGDSLWPQLNRDGMSKKPSGSLKGDGFLKPHKSEPQQPQTQKQNQKHGAQAIKTRKKRKIRRSKT
jgi:hypothetical protein